MRDNLNKIIILLLALCGSASMAWAEDFTVGSFNYTVLSDGTSVEVRAASGVVLEGEITIPGQVTNPETGNTYDVTTIANYGFDASSKKTAGITSLILGEGIMNINIAGFKGLKNLTNLKLPNTIYKFGDGILSGCTALKRLSLPGSLTYASGLGSGVLLDKLTFEESPNPLQSSSGLSVSGSSFRAKRVYVDRDLMNGTINDAAEEVHFGGYATTINVSFRGAKNLKIVICGMNDNIVKINGHAFEGCTGLEEARLFDLPEVGQRAFSGCTSLKIVLWDGADKIDVGTFENCTSLEGAPGAVWAKRIEDRAYENCTSIKRVNMAFATYIGPYAFRGCTSLESVDFGSSYWNARLETIGSQVWKGCTKVKSLHLPNSVTTMQKDALDGLTLESLTFDFAWMEKNDKTLSITYPLEGVTVDTLRVNRPVVCGTGSIFADTQSPHVLFLNIKYTGFSPSTFANCTGLTDIYAPWIEKNDPDEEVEHIPSMPTTSPWSPAVKQHATLWVQDKWEEEYYNRGWNFANIKPYKFGVNITVSGEGFLRYPVMDRRGDDTGHEWRVYPNDDHTYYRPQVVSVFDSIPLRAVIYDEYNDAQHEIVVTINGNPVPVDENGNFMLKDVTEVPNINVVFRENWRTITATVDGSTGGRVKIVPEDTKQKLFSTRYSSKAHCGEPATLYIDRAPFFRLVSVVVNDVDMTDLVVPDPEPRRSDYMLEFPELTENTTITLSFQPTERADINTDGVVDEKDIQMMVDFISGKKEYYIILQEPDFNEDSKVSISDLTRLIKLMSE